MWRRPVRGMLVLLHEVRSGIRILQMLKSVKAAWKPAGSIHRRTPLDAADMPISRTATESLQQDLPPAPANLRSVWMSRFELLSSRPELQQLRWPSLRMSCWSVGREWVVASLRPSVLLLTQPWASPEPVCGQEGLSIALTQRRIPGSTAFFAVR